MKRINITFKFLLICTVIVFCFLTSCRSKRQETQKVDTIIETTKEKTVSYRDTILYAPKSETSLKIPVSDLTFKQDLNNVQKPKIFTQKNGNATAKIVVVLDSIEVTATCDSLALAAKIKNKLETEYRLKEVNDQIKKDTSSGWTFWDLIIAFVVGFLACFILKFFKVV
ncbi:hypothetical protein GJU43_14025 [Flavobacterium sp. LC2016-23]|uniref:hypothetical protein n=1 Tax=Flavobacterium sp. LC2016-23 TaxID=2666330 RepID=UPI0012AF50C1|nr:hypothetical protein [Flavobacterium sp. LC2016-23]MRX40401.1 hypothetical protein [Flavobacterium sp. LC2016-23]